MPGLFCSKDMDGATSLTAFTLVSKLLDSLTGFLPLFPSSAISLSVSDKEHPQSMIQPLPYPIPCVVLLVFLLHQGFLKSVGCTGVSKVSFSFFPPFHIICLINSPQIPNVSGCNVTNEKQNFKGWEYFCKALQFPLDGTCPSLSSCPYCSMLNIS